MLLFSHMWRIAFWQRTERELSKFKKRKDKIHRSVEKGGGREDGNEHEWKIKGVERTEMEVSSSVALIHCLWSDRFIWIRSFSKPFFKLLRDSAILEGHEHQIYSYSNTISTFHVCLDSLVQQTCLVQIVSHNPKLHVSSLSLSPTPQNSIHASILDCITDAASLSSSTLLFFPISIFALLSYLFWHHNEQKIISLPLW